jgi:hypothetical protein
MGLGRIRSGQARACCVVATAVVVGVLVGAVPASALADFTWSGAGGDVVWSDAGNWSGAAAPSGSVGTLTFPALSSCSGCTYQAAYWSADDVAGLTANAVSIDDSAPYVISGSQSLTLGAGGITAAPRAHAGAAAWFSPGVVLAAPQTWTISGDGAGARAGLDLGMVTGASDPLAIQLNDGAQVDLGDVETGALTITGSGVLGVGSLNATDGNPVIVSSGVSMVAYRGGIVGPLQLNDSALSLPGGGPLMSGGTLTVEGGLRLDATSSVSMQIGYIASTSPAGPIIDTPQIGANGPIDLGDASLALLPADSCPIFSPDQTYTLITTTGSLTGEFAGVPDGTTVTLSSSCPGATQALRINYTPNSVIATVVSPGPAPTSTTLTTDPATAVTNQPVTLTATVAASYGSPAGTVSFGDIEGPIAGCTDVPVAAQGSSGTAICTTSFTAESGSSGEELYIGYEPSDSSTRASSNTFDTLVFGSIVVGKAATTSAVRASSAIVASGRSVTYTATVTPADPGSAVPTGAIAFDRNGDTVGTCSKQPLHLIRGTATATCTISHATTGKDKITARYTGDGNFNGSKSGSTTVTIWSQPALAAQLRPSAKAATIPTMLRERHVAQRIRVTTTGTLTIRWYGTTSPRNHPPTLLATGRTTYGRAGTKTITVALTSTGRTILTHAHRIRITVSATFAATGSPPATLTRSFRLER